MCKSFGAKLEQKIVDLRKLMAKQVKASAKLSLKNDKKE